MSHWWAEGGTTDSDKRLEIREGRGTILVVDDDLESLRLLTEILREEGYNVRPADAGELALRSAQERVPDLILLDMRMPGVDGFEVCRRLKALRNDPPS